MIVRNNTERVIVLKSFDAAPLRLLPGLNEVEGDLKVYTNGNPAAAAVVKDSLSMIGPDGLSSEEKAEAKAAKAKNDKLNVSAKVLKVAQENLLKAEKKVSESSDAIEHLMKKVSQLEDKAKDDGEKDAKIKELEAKLKALTPAPKVEATKAK